MDKKNLIEIITIFFNLDVQNNPTQIEASDIKEKRNETRGIDYNQVY